MIRTRRFGSLAARSWGLSTQAQCPRFVSREFESGEGMYLTIVCVVFDQNKTQFAMCRDGIRTREGTRVSTTSVEVLKSAEQPVSTEGMRGAQAHDLWSAREKNKRDCIAVVCEENARKIVIARRTFVGRGNGGEIRRNARFYDG